MSASARFGEGAKFDAGEMVASVAGTECGSRPAAHCFDSVVIVSPYFWNFGSEMWQTTHHVAQEFARIVPTVVIEPSPTWNVWSEQFNARRLLQSIVGAPAFSPEPNVAVFRRRGLPLGRLRSVRERALAGNARRFTRALKERGFQRTLLWHSFPYWSESLVDSIDHSLLAYHCLDHCTRDEERRLIGKADVVFSVSETLVERHGRVNGQSYLLPNGVDLTLFDREGAARQRRPEELPTGGRLIGFVGSINCHLDIELLLTVAHSFPRDFLVLVGNVLSNETAPRGAQAEAFKRLKSLRNVRCLGFRPPTRSPPMSMPSMCA